MYTFQKGQFICLLSSVIVSDKSPALVGAWVQILSWVMWCIWWGALNDSRWVNLSDRRAARTSGSFVNIVSFSHFFLNAVKDWRLLFLDIVTGHISPLVMGILYLPPVLWVIQQKEFVILSQTELLWSLGDVIIFGYDVTIFNGFSCKSLLAQKIRMLTIL